MPARPRGVVPSACAQANIFHFYGDPQFLKALFGDPAFAEERNAFKENLAVVVGDLRRHLDVFKQQPRKCYVNACTSLACPQVCAACEG